MNNKLIVSVAVLKSIYEKNTGVDIKGLLSNFIKDSIMIRKETQFTVTDCKSWLYDDFGFDIPDAVVRTTIKSIFVRSGVMRMDQGYVYVVGILESSVDITKEESDCELIWKQVSSRFIEFKKEVTAFKALDDEASIQCLIDHLQNEKIPSEYMSLVSSFIIHSQSLEETRKDIQFLEKAFILYGGIRYTNSTTSALGAWETDTVLLFDTDILLSLGGYHGSLRRDTVLELLDLVAESNRGKKGKISLGYFSEAESEVEGLFRVAQSIANGQRQLNSPRSAIVQMLLGVKSGFEIEEKRAAFWRVIKNHHIKLTNADISDLNGAFNLESMDIINSILSSDEVKSNWDVDEGKASYVLSQMSKVNVIRRGNSDRLLNCKAIFISGSGFVNFASYFLLNNLNINVPLASNLEFITSKLWFHMGRGFGGEYITPKVMSIVNRSTMIMSSLIDDKVTGNYKELLSRHKNGEIDDAHLKDLVVALYREQKNPDDLKTGEDLSSGLDFLFCIDYIESYDHKQKHYAESVEKLDLLSKEYNQNRIELDRSEIENKKLKAVIRAQRNKEIRAEKLKLINEVRYKVLVYRIIMISSSIVFPVLFLFGLDRFFGINFFDVIAEETFLSLVSALSYPYAAFKIIKTKINNYAKKTASECLARLKKGACVVESDSVEMIAA